MSAVLAVAIGLLTGILSGFGIGGGSLLLLYLTLFEGAGQYQAGGINLLYFLPAGLMALPAHIKNGCIEKKALVPAIGAGLLCAALAAWAATALDVALLHRFFGAFLLYIGITELFRKGTPKD